MRNSIDISWPISPKMTNYKDRKPVAITDHATITRDGAADSSLYLNMHTGTHVDAPAHFIENGAMSESISVAALNGPCRVVDLTNCAAVITVADLCAHEPVAGERLLLKTRNSLRSSEAPFDFEFVYLSAEAAAYLTTCQIALVGIDALGIERDQPGHPTHKALFSAGITILEGLRLGQVAAGSYTLYCLPLLISGREAAPARALLTPLE